MVFRSQIIFECSSRAWISAFMILYFAQLDTEISGDFLTLVCATAVVARDHSATEWQESDLQVFSFFHSFCHLLAYKILIRIPAARDARDNY